MVTPPVKPIIRTCSVTDREHSSYLSSGFVIFFHLVKNYGTKVSLPKVYQLILKSKSKNFFLVHEDIPWGTIESDLEAMAILRFLSRKKD
mmetsp:Transcript_5655/g.7015  ORF Transcript_5655/g.7015 Transcript_5655/m.7015 type:complete len:90 (+) Transcript_5655:226-495(+)